MTFEHKSVSLDVKADAQGVVEGFASVFGGVDTQGDTIERGAFLRSIGEKMPRMLWQHDRSMPIGRWTEAREDDRGLFVRGQISVKSDMGRNAAALLADGAVDAMSIGFLAKGFRFEDDGERRILSEIDLREVSFVTFPADAEARVTSIKASQIETVREFEDFLRKHGFSRDGAKVIVSRGFKGYLDRLREAGSGDPEVDLREAEGLKTSLENMLKGMKR